MNEMIIGYRPLTVAVRGCLPPWASVCVAAPTNQISFAISVFSGFRTCGV